MLVTEWNLAGVSWRSWSAAEMSWVLYRRYVSLLDGIELKRFLTVAEDVVSLRALDRNAFQESDLSVGGPNG